MNGFAPFVFLAAVLSMSPLNAAVDNRSESPVIRAGHSIAVTTCIACHVVDSAQTVAPVFGGGIPRYSEAPGRYDGFAHGHDEVLRGNKGTRPRTLLAGQSHFGSRARAGGGLHFEPAFITRLR
jgi:hypothetical protein